ncbi:Kinase, PIKK [Spironucleus salmonicida]|uniref:Kinase, PIKK n=1 Tax=Spironucleus salmonicida TaxID=348837 RepID=V6M6S7_9EUKA|nr:Kinase, PIKK [Spironucleus salmonicida]|eukprot:EST49124.1 Kinase, PIKK [Spironucleus salmonicida]
MCYHETDEVRMICYLVLIKSIKTLDNVVLTQNILSRIIDQICGEKCNNNTQLSLTILTQNDIIHLMLYENFLDQITALIYATDIEIQIKTVILLSKLFKYDITGLKSQVLREHFFFCLNGLQNINPDIGKIKFISRCLNDAHDVFLVHQPIIAKIFSKVKFNLWNEESIVQVITGFSGFFKFLQIDIRDYLEGFMEQLTYLIMNDSDKIIKAVLLALHEIVRSQASSILYYLLVPQLFPRLIYFIKNKKNNEIYLEATKALVILGPINSEIDLSKIEKECTNTFLQNSQTYNNMILVKHINQQRKVTAIDSHGIVIFDQVNQRITDMSSVLYKQSDLNFHHDNITSEILNCIFWSMKCEISNARISSIVAFKNILLHSSEKQLKFDVLRHVTRICEFLKSSDDFYFQLIVIQNLTHIVQYISYILPFMQQIIIEAILKLMSNKNLKSNLLSLIEQITYILDSTTLAYKQDIFQFVFQNFEKDSSMELAKRTLTTILVLKKQIESEIHLLIPQILKSTQYFQDTIYVEKALDVVMRIFCYFKAGKQFSNIIYQYLLKFYNTDTKNFYFIAICCIFDTKLLYFLIQKRKLFEQTPPYLQNLLLAVKLLDERGFILNKYYLLGCFNSINNQCIEPIYLNYPDIKLDFTNVEYLAKQISENQTPLSLTLNQPYLFGAALVSIKQESLVLKADTDIWKSPNCNNTEEWNQWFSIFIANLIKQSANKFIASCFNLASLSVMNQQTLINFSIFELLQNEQKRITYLSLISNVTKKIFSNTVPFNIQLYFINMIDFLNRNSVDISYLMNYDTIAELSDKYQAYNRSLRIREVLYDQSSAQYVDMLFKTYKRLYFVDSAKSLLKIEQIKLDKQFLLTLGLLAKKYIKYFSKLPFTSSYETIMQNIEKYDLQGFQIQFQIITGNQIYLENMFLQDTVITANTVIQTIQLQFTEFFIQFTELTFDQKDKIAECILAYILTKLKPLFIQIFNPKPAWFEASFDYNQAIQLYTQQQLVIETFLIQETPQSIQRNPKLIQQLKDSYREYYAISLSKISAQFSLGNYNQLLTDIQAFKDITESLSYLEPYKKQQYVEKFNIQIAKYAVEALIDSNYDEASQWVEKIPGKQESSKLLFQIIISTKTNKYTDALEKIVYLKHILAKQIQTSIQENYDRAYEQLIDFQQVIELQEANSFLVAQKQSLEKVTDETSRIIIEKENNKRIKHLQLLWSRRLANIRQDIEFWISLVRIRKLIIPVHQDYSAYVSFANQALKSGRIYLARNLIESLFNKKPQNLFRMYHNNNKQYSINSDNLDILIPPLEIQSSEVIYCYSKLLFKDYKIENKVAGFVHLTRLALQLKEGDILIEKVHFKIVEMLKTLEQQQTHLKDDDIHDSLVNNIYRIYNSQNSNSITSEQTDSDVYSSTLSQLSDSSRTFTDKSSLIKILVRNQTKQCFKITSDMSSNEEILQILETGAAVAQNCDLLAFRAAEVSFQLFNQEPLDLSISSISLSSTNVISKTSNQKYLEKAIQYLFQAVKNDNLRIQAGLQIINIISQYQLCDEIEQLVLTSMQETEIENWLPILPQLTLYATKYDFKYNQQLQQIILSLGIKFPQETLTLLYCNANIDNIIIQNQLVQIIDIIIRNSQDIAIPLLQTLQELNKVSQSTFEKTYDKCQTFITLLNTNLISEFFDQFTILIQEYNLNSQIPLEVSFNQLIYPKLIKVWDFFKQSILNLNPSIKDDLISHFIDISSELQEQIQQQNLPLNSISPFLSQLKQPNFMLFGSNTIKVERFLPQLLIIPSKQCPRKLGIQATDGEVYCYLLKGKEDLRQDERVMQFLMFINSIFQTERIAFSTDITVHFYPVIPLSSQSGLIFWVPKTCSLLDIIQKQRKSQNVSESTEMNQIMFRADNYSILSLSQRVDAMLFSQLSCPSTDLRKELFAISCSSENFIERRSPFIATLAAMSAIGHVIGLGDRHPGNILLYNMSSRVLHIDYGDCFEAAQKREKFPEKVPFRLTRILEKALDACGTQGYFKTVLSKCLHVMKHNQSYILTIFRDFIEQEQLEGMSKKMNGYELWGNYTDDDQHAVKLITVAENLENLCQSYAGWAPQW